LFVVVRLTQTTGAMDL